MTTEWQSIFSPALVQGMQCPQLCLCLQVLVMEDGRVKEYDSPANLMQIPNGTFRAMVVEAGLSDDSAGSALQ